MKYMPDETVPISFAVRQAMADQENSPQRDKGSLNVELDKLLAPHP